MRRPALLWSDVDTVKLIELWLVGVSIKAIARKLGRSERAIAAKAQRLRDEDGVDLPMRNPAGAVPGWQIRRNLARAAG